MNKIGFDTDLYIKAQIQQIEGMLTGPAERFYFEIGGKLMQDRHAARVLPGYREDARFEIVKNLGLMSDILVAVSAKDIVKGRIRGDFKISYDQETLRLIKELRQQGLVVKNVVMTMFEEEMESRSEIQDFEKELQQNNLSVFRFFNLENYSADKFSPKDFDKNPRIDFSSRIVSVISPGGGSGKFGVCLSQLYHEMKQGVAPGYFSLGAFPIYELPSNHPLNLAYLAAMADKQDLLKEDPYMPGSLLTEREIENFDILRKLADFFNEEGRFLREISSPTKMAVSSLKLGIVDEEEVQKEAAAEIARRYVRYKFECEKNQETKETVDRVKRILEML